MKKPKNKTYSLRMDRIYLDKKYCLKLADEIIRDGRITGMNRVQIAEEINAHASAYYFCTWLEKYHLRFRFVKSKADPIDLADNGDFPFRRFCYHIVWQLTGGRKAGPKE